MTTIEYLQKELRRVEISIARARKKPNSKEELFQLGKKRRCLEDAIYCVRTISEWCGVDNIKPVVRGRWVKIYEDGEPAIKQPQVGVCCSKCMKMPEDKFTESRFCPNCGADMREGKE